MKTNAESLKKLKIISIVTLIIVYNILVIFLGFKHNTAQITYTLEKTEYQINASNNFELPVIIKNNSKEVFSSENNYFLSYHMYDTQETLIQNDFGRSSLSHSVKQNSQSSEKVNIEPLEAGTYIIKIDLVHEGVKWFGPSENIKLIVK